MEIKCTGNVQSLHDVKTEMQPSTVVSWSINRRLNHRPRTVYCTVTDKIVMSFSVCVQQQHFGRI